MKIEGNQKELDAMAEFHKGNRTEGLRLQEEFAAEFREEYKDKDHCSCQKACRYHGNCKECVAIHRAHQEHVPNCMRPLINKKLKLLSELTEHTLAALEHAFEFMEDAFGDSQEMVSFVTELNTNYYSIQFLKENDCDKYYQYNKKLLFDKQQEEILSEMDEIEQDLNTAVK